MPKRSSKKPRQSDVNQTAADVVRIATEPEEPPPPEKNPAAVALGRMGGLKGGKARAAKLTKAERAAIAKKAAAARWGPKKDR
jgi:hypothetical protein